MPTHILPRADWKPYCENARGKPTEYVSRRFGTVREFTDRATGKKFWQAVPRAEGAFQRQCTNIWDAMASCENPEFKEKACTTRS